MIAETIRVLENSHAPDLAIQRRAIAPGLLQGLIGGRRPCLMVSHTANAHLKPFTMYVTTRDYGRHLQVSWYLVHQTSCWELMMNAILCIPVISLLVYPFYALGKVMHAKESGILQLNLFDEQVLKSYVTNAHQCLLDAVAVLTHEHKCVTFLPYHFARS